MESMEENKIEPIILYPSNWLYNAGVIGFLKVIACGKGENVIEGWLNDNGTIKIKREIFKESIDFYKEYNKNRGEKELPLVGKNKLILTISREEMNRPLRIIQKILGI